MPTITPDAIPSIFGQISPPAGMNIGGNDPVAGFGQFVSFGITAFITVAGLFLLVYLFWGALDWITSSGEKEKITKAQNKITNALIGMILIFAVLVVFNVFAGKMLGIIEPTPNGWQFKIPTL